MPITPLPPAPQRDQDPTTFANTADTFVAALPTLVTEINATTSGIDADIATATAAAASASSSSSSAATSALLSEDWAIQTGSPVAGGEYSSKEHAVGTSVTTGSSKDWASKTGSPVAGGEYSAKKYADDALSYKNTAEVAAAAAQAAAGLPSLVGNAGKVLLVNVSETGVQWGSELKVKLSQRTSDAAITASENGYLIDITSGTFTQTFAAAATLSNGFYCYIRNSGTGDITLDPNGVETIDGLSSYIMYPGEVRLIQCDGVALRTIVISPFNKTFTASSNFIKPPGYATFGGMLWSGGASGRRTGATSTVSAGGGGGGCFPFTLPASSLASSTAVTIGSGGTAVTIAAAGNSGGNSSFAGITVIGGEGTTNGSYGGSVSINGIQLKDAVNAPDGFGAGNPFNSSDLTFAVYGGGASRQNATAASGSSVFGGGAGGSISSGNVVQNAGTSVFAGAGGAASTSGNGTAGAVPGGGGGATQTGTQSGAGARGEMRIWGVV